MSDDVAIKVEGVSKSFKLPHEKLGSIKSVLVGWLRRKRGYEVQQVLEDVSFEIKKGEFFGIVGRNGSGKSTLLKLISQIYIPDKGHIQVNGKLTPFIELGVGFNPELSGRDNVYLNGALLGFSRKEMESMYDEIVEFAELERFMDQKLKNYSSGMQVRLAFSIAIRAKSDILVLDEVLAVGDEAFQKKCQDYFLRAKREGKTVVLVTHAMESVRQFCDRALLIQDGEVKAVGNPDKVANAYSEVFLKEYIEQLERQQSGRKTQEAAKLSDVTLEEIVVRQNGKHTKVITFREDFCIDVVVNAEKDHKDLIVGVRIVSQSGHNLVSLTTKQLGAYDLHAGRNKIRYNIQNILSEGGYYLNVAIMPRRGGRFLIQETETSPFSVVGMDKIKYAVNGMVYPNLDVEVVE